MFHSFIHSFVQQVSTYAESLTNERFYKGLLCLSPVIDIWSKWRNALKTA